MNIFIEHIEGEFAVCRLPDKKHNLIRIPLRELPKGTKALDVVTLRDNGTFYNNRYAKEERFKEICKSLNYKKYKFIFFK